MSWSFFLPVQVLFTIVPGNTFMKLMPGPLILDTMSLGQKLVGRMSWPKISFSPNLAPPPPIDCNNTYWFWSFDQVRWPLCVAKWRLPDWRLVKWCLVKWRLVKWRLVKWRLVKWHLVKWRLVKRRLVKWRLVKWRSVWKGPHGCTFKCHLYSTKMFVYTLQFCLIHHSVCHWHTRLSESNISESKCWTLSGTPILD